MSAVGPFGDHFALLFRRRFFYVVLGGPWGAFWFPLVSEMWFYYNNIDVLEK